MPGYIKLYRQLLDSAIWNTEEKYNTRDAFIYILLKANWKEGYFSKDGHTISVERGQLLTSVRNLGTAFGWSKCKVSRFLKDIQLHKIGTVESVGFGTLITIVNYGKYQDGQDTQIPSEEDSKRTQTGTAKGQQEDSKRTQTDHNIRIYKKNKEGEESILTDSEDGSRPSLDARSRPRDGLLKDGEGYAFATADETDGSEDGFFTFEEHEDRKRRGLE